MKKSSSFLNLCLVKGLFILLPAFFMFLFYKRKPSTVDEYMKYYGKVYCDSSDTFVVSQTSKDTDNKDAKVEY